MTAHPPESVLGWIRDAAGGAIASIRSMGVAATTLHAVDARDGSGTVRRLVVRRFHDLERLRTDPWYVPSNEARVLDILDDTEVPAPRLLAADIYARVCDVPALLMTRAPGRPTARPWDVDAFLIGMAQALARINEVPVENVLPHYEPHYEPAVHGDRRPPEWTAGPKLWQRAFEALTEAPPDTPVGFLHRDFHPGQLLWSGDRLTGVVDWTTGCTGPFGVDLASMRRALAMDYGLDLADRFLTVHREASGWDLYHPYWDLMEAADAILTLPPPQTQEIADAYGRLEHWVAQSLARL